MKVLFNIPPLKRIDFGAKAPARELEFYEPEFMRVRREAQALARRLENERIWRLIERTCKL